MAVEDFEPLCLIWSREHDAWWRPGRHGYTPDIAYAGIYVRSEALEICAQATIDWRKPPNELPVRLADLDDVAKALVNFDG